MTVTCVVITIGRRAEDAKVLTGLRSGDGPLSVRARPSSIKRDCDRRATSTGETCLAHLHAKSRLILGCLCGHSGQKTRARREPARTGRGPSPATCGPACYWTVCAELTATVTATAATNGKRQRPATAHNTRTIRGNWGYVRPEKQTVEDQRQGAVTVACTVAKPLDKARPMRTTVECPSSTRSPFHPGGEGFVTVW
jgi:hypothetical protein